MHIESINPATGEIIERLALHTDEQAAEIACACETAQLGWRETDFSHRATLMHAAAGILRRDARLHAETITREMGKPLAQSLAEIEKCAWTCDWYADNAAAILAPELAESDGSRAFVRFDPLGVVLAVMPWNFPHWQVFRFAAPALMAGNGALLKHASNVPRCALMIEDVFKMAGFPANLFRTVLISSAQTAAVVRHPAVKAVTLTGSEPAGAAVAAVAGTELKKTVLELGGSDPFIVLADADIEAAATLAAAARCINTGQSCIAAKRFIVERRVAERFELVLIDRMSRKVVGDPMDPETEIGPLARPDLVDDLHRQVQRSIERGAECWLGGDRLDELPGFYYAPTVLTHVGPGMPAYDEEVFGPVAAVIRAADEDDAIRIANDTPYGLGAALFTADLHRAERLAARIDAGSVFVNGLVKSDPRLPFGGIKRSGYGRELSHYGIKEFVNVKTVWMK